MLNTVRSLCLCILGTCSLGIINGQTTLIRTFVNGNPENANIRDLHIEYTKPLSEGPQFQPVLNPFAGYRARINWNSLTGNQVDVEFNRDLTPGESVSIAATAPGTGLAVKRWWWTDSDHKKVSRTVTVGKKKITYTDYPGTMRGDEDVPPSGDDPYAIINKNHHWGGKDRLTGLVNITMNISRFLRDRPDGMDAGDLEAMVKLAVKQWVDASKRETFNNVPKAGNDENPENEGPGKDPPVMAPGPSHAKANGEKFRSLTVREAAAARLKYPNGINIEVITDLEVRTGDILVVWKDNLKPLGYGPSEAGDKTQPEKTTAGAIQMKKTPPKSRSWHVVKDTNGDGYITNEDGEKIGDDQYDLYSIFKHELGHVLCFYHSGEQHFEDEAVYQAPQLLDTLNFFSGISPYPFLSSDPELIERDVVYFADTRPEGFGGMDIWQAVWKDSVWALSNLGPVINTAADEVDPHLASDGSLLLFASNRDISIRGYDLFAAIRDPVSEQWLDPERLGDTINSPYDDRHPSLRADMATMYFASNRPGGLGGFDIWRSEIVPGVGFTAASNPGAPVNSPSDEEGAAISPSGTSLIFSSNQPEGLGGYDLWVSLFDEGWQTPVNLGEKINSPANEIDPGIRLDAAYLYFSSDRRTQGEAFELYEVSLVAVRGTSLFRRILLISVIAVLIFVPVFLLLRKRKKLTQG